MNVSIIIGHTENSPGARFLGGEFNEYNYNTCLAERISCELGAKDHYGFVIRKDGLTNEQVAEVAERHDPDAIIEIHCNAYNEKVRGTETLYIENNYMNFLLSDVIHYNIISALNRTGKTNRMAKKISPDDFGYVNLKYHKDPACLIEPFFIDNKEDMELGIKRIDAISKAIANGLIKFDGNY